MKICLTGGGTAGHITPNIALKPTLKNYFDEMFYIGSKKGLEKQLIEEAKVMKYYEITTTKLVRRSILKNLAIPFLLLKGISESKKILKTENPDIIFSKGGFVSVPVALAAKKLNIPLICHESDLSLGLANKIVSKKAKYVCTNFPETADHTKRGVFTGSPIRNSLLLATKADSIKKLNLDPSKKVIVVTGGSLGAKVINDNIEKILGTLTKTYEVYHITGKDKKLNFNHKNYHQTEFTNDIGTIFSAADIVISRAGSNTIFELAAIKKPMLLIPLPKGNSRGDQVDNANYFYNSGFANMLQEKDLNSENLLKKIEETFKNASSYKTNLIRANFTSGTEKIAKLLVNSLAKK